MTPVRISLLAVGGTISTVTSATGAVPGLNAEDLLAASASSRLQNIEIRPVNVSNVSSRAITPIDMWEIAEKVRQEIQDGANGIVITHGTDTLEETAYALALLADTSVPVVLTGAMRTPTALGADGPANLAAAITVAQNPVFAAYGPVVVFQDEIHAARWVTKSQATRVAGFSSAIAGPVGYVVEGRVVQLLGPPPYQERLERITLPTKRVELLWAVSGADEMIVEAIGTKIDGLVVAGTGGGHVAPPMADALVRLAESGCPIVIASRTFDAQTLRETYGGRGSETHLLSGGLVSAGSLGPIKARLRLIFGLSADYSVNELFPSAERSPV